MGAGHQQKQAMIRGLEFSTPAPTPHPCSPERGGELEVELMMDHAYVIPQVWGLEHFQVGEQEHVHVSGGWCTANSTGTEAPVFRTLLDLTLGTFSSGYSFIPFNILCTSRNLVLVS